MRKGHRNRACKGCNTGRTQGDYCMECIAKRLPSKKLPDTLNNIGRMCNFLGAGRYFEIRDTHYDGGYWLRDVRTDKAYIARLDQLTEIY